MKGMLVNTLRSARVDCTNGGVSARFNEFVLTGENVAEVFEPKSDAPELKLVYRANLDYYHAEPVNGKRPHSVGWMFGGNYIVSSDSRFKSLTVTQYQYMTGRRNATGKTFWLVINSKEG